MTHPHEALAEAECQECTNGEAIDLTPVIDALAKAMYEDLDSHAQTMTWDEYKADDPNGAAGIYSEPMGRYMRRSLPALGRAILQQRAAAADHFAEAVTEARARERERIATDLQRYASTARSRGGDDLTIDAYEHAAHVALDDESKRADSLIVGLLGASSLGTSEAQALRATVSDERAAQVVARADSLAPEAPTPEHVKTAANCTAGGPGAPISSGLICKVCPAPTDKETPDV